jgi:phospholipase C
MFLERLFTAYRNMRSQDGSNVWNTTLFIGWDEPGGTYDHVPPGPVPAPQASAPAGQFDFRFDRSGYRVPAIVVSPWVEPGSVYNEEHRHTSMLATLREGWGLGEPFTQRDAAARPFGYVFSRQTPTDPDAWDVPKSLPAQPYHVEWESSDKTLSALGKVAIPGVIAQAKAMGIPLPAEVTDPNFHLTTELLNDIQVLVGAHFWPKMGPQGADLTARLEDFKKALHDAVQSQD